MRATAAYGFSRPLAARIANRAREDASRELLDPLAYTLPRYFSREKGRVVRDVNVEADLQSSELVKLHTEITLLSDKRDASLATMALHEAFQRTLVRVMACQQVLNADLRILY